MFFWTSIAFLLYLVGAMLWTAPPEYMTFGNITSLVLLVLALVALATITRKGAQRVLNGKVGDNHVSGAVYDQFLPVGEMLFGFTFSAVIATCFLYLTFTNIPVAYDICENFWEYAKQLHEIQIQNLNIPSEH